MTQAELESRGWSLQQIQHAPDALWRATRRAATGAWQTQESHTLESLIAAVCRYEDDLVSRAPKAPAPVVASPLDVEKVDA